MDLFFAFATDHVVRGSQLFQVDVMLTTVAMYAVPERTQAVAQVFWELMHFWAYLGIGCRLRMMVVADAEGDSQPSKALLPQLL